MGVTGIEGAPVRVPSSSTTGSRPRSLLIAACVAAGGLLCNCAPGSPTASSGGDAPESPAGSTGSAVSSADDANYLQRRDTPPEGVAAQLQFFAGGGPPCAAVDESTPAINVEGMPWVAGVYRLCVTGIEAAVPIEVALTLPDGTTRDYTLTSRLGGIALQHLAVLPGEPIGTYRATATQGRTQITGSYEVTRATVPSALTVPPTEGPPGSTFRFGLAGFPPDSEIELDLYQRDGDNAARYLYLTTLPPAMTDGVGEAIYELPTAADDPVAGYCVVYRVPTQAPHSECDASFRLTP